MATNTDLYAALFNALPVEDQLEVAGKLNLEAATVAEVVVPTATPEELFEAANVLFGNGRKTAPTKSGRAKRILGDADGVHPYRVIITKG